jgi:hypothetical protein
LDASWKSRARSSRPSALNGEGGIRITRKSSGKTGVSSKAGTESGTDSSKTTAAPQLPLSMTWDQLPEEVRQRLASLTPDMIAALHALFSGLHRPS